MPPPPPELPLERYTLIYFFARSFLICFICFHYSFVSFWSTYESPFLKVLCTSILTCLLLFSYVREVLFGGLMYVHGGPIPTFLYMRKFLFNGLTHVCRGLILFLSQLHVRIANIVYESTA